MEQRLFHFDEATPLLAFLENHRDYYIGHILKAVYAYCMYTKAMDENMVFLVLDDYCIGIEYLFESDLSILTADKNDFEIEDEVHNDSGDKYIRFHSHITTVRDVHSDWCVWTPAMNQKIMDAHANCRHDLSPARPLGAQPEREADDREKPGGKTAKQISCIRRRN